MKSRSLFLYILLAITLAATWWTARHDGDDSGTVEAIERPHKAKSSRQNTAGADFSRTVLKPAATDAFAPRDWMPPPPPPPEALPPPPPPPPTAPPLPYRYLGKWQEDGQLIVILQTGNRSTLIKGGEILDGHWRVDEITPRAVQFTYLPLDQTTTLKTGDAL